MLKTETKPFKKESQVYSFECRYGFCPPFFDDMVASIYLGEEILNSIEIVIEDHTELCSHCGYTPMHRKGDY